MNQSQRIKINDFILRLVQLKHEAGTLGLYRTMHALEVPVTEVGWELADQLEKAAKNGI